MYQFGGAVVWGFFHERPPLGDFLKSTRPSHRRRAERVVISGFAIRLNQHS
jgi:hypothetical protein